MNRFGNPDFSFLESVDDHHSVGKRLLQEGKSFADVRRHLAKAGVREQNILPILFALTTDIAKTWLAEGLTSPQVIQRLIDRGVSAQEAYKAVDKSILQKQRLEKPSQRLYVENWQFPVGIGLVFVGFFLWGGNVFGYFPTISGAGYITSILGASLAGYQYYHDR